MVLNQTFTIGIVFPYTLTVVPIICGWLMFFSFLFYFIFTIKISSLAVGTS